MAEGTAPVENDALFSVSRMAELLESGTDSQRTVILFELQQLLDHCLEDTINVLIPVLCRNVHKWTYELQISSTEALLDVLNQDVQPECCKMICEAALLVVRQSRSEDLFEAWGEILVVGLPSVKWDSQKELQEISDTLETFASDDDDVSRKLAARVYGSFAACLESDEVEALILRRALELASDPDLEVRGMVAESLAFIGAVVRTEITEKKVWPRICSLLMDPDARIHAATLRTLAHILEAHREKSPQSVLYSELLAPVFARECDFVRKAATADQRTVTDETYLLLEIISEVFGQLIYAMHDFFPDENARKDAYKAFLAMATCNGPIVRRYCAYNIPGVSKSLASKFSTEMSSIVEFLSRDTDSETRWNLAAGIHETAAVLANKSSIDNFFKSVIALLQDENPLVRMNTLEHFFPLLQSLTKESELGSMRRLAPVFANLTLLSEGNWRTQELLAKQLEQACILVPPDTLRGNVLPLLYQMSEESTYLVRKAAMPAIARAIWCIPAPHDREDAMHNFRMNWAEGGVFWMRMAFVDCAFAASQYYSGQLFRRTFSASVLRMAEDPVPNVRLRLASTIHHLAFACQDMEELESAVATLEIDNDKDVFEAMAGYKERVAELNMGENAKDEELVRQRAEGELFTKLVAQKAKEQQETSKKNYPSQHGKSGKFRASNMMIGKGNGKRDSAHDALSPTSVVDQASPKGVSSRRSLGTTAAPKENKQEAVVRRNPRSVAHQGSKDEVDLQQATSPRRISKKMLGSSSADDEDDGPPSGKKIAKAAMKGVLLIGKKNKK